MMKKIIHLTLDLFIHNALGWILVFANFTVIYFLIWITSDVVHTQMPSNGKPYKITIISSYKVNGIAPADFVMNLVTALNSPALNLSNLFYQTFSQIRQKIFQLLIKAANTVGFTSLKSVAMFFL